MILWGLGLCLEGMDHHPHGEEDLVGVEGQEEVEGLEEEVAMVALSPALEGLLVPAFMEEQEVVAVLDIPQVEGHVIPVNFHHIPPEVAVPILARHLTRYAHRQESTILLHRQYHQNPHLK